MSVLIKVSGNQLHFKDKQYRCAIGRGGFAGDKREGDGCTPLGAFPLRSCWYRADKMTAPKTGLPLRLIEESDGWCDDPRSAEYNRHILLPLREGISFERLFRDDHVYDVIVPLGHNDHPPVPGKGSAIFLHLAHDDYRPTEGCVALLLPDLLEVLEGCDKRTVMEIREE